MGVGVKIKQERKLAGTLPEWQDLPLTWLAIAGLAPGPPAAAACPAGGSEPGRGWGEADGSGRSGPPRLSSRPRRPPTAAPDRMRDPTDAYKMLQVDSEAEDEVIQAAYRRLAQKYHPDVSGRTRRRRPDGRDQQGLGDLRDPARRAAHDRQSLAAQRARRHARPRHGRDGHRLAGRRAASARAPRPAPTRRRTAPGGQRRGHRRTVSSDWTSGRSNAGGGFDASTMSAPNGVGSAGPPPGNPSGSVLNFGRYLGWSLGEISRSDIEYIEWLDRTPIGRIYQVELDDILRSHGRRVTTVEPPEKARGLFRRR